MAAIWDADLTTRMGAESAADTGGLACFVFAGLCVLAGVFYGGSMGYDTLDGITFMVVTGVEALVAVIAGFRLRDGLGSYWGIATIAIMALELIAKIAQLAIGVGLVFNVMLLIVTVQGVRGAFALRKSHFDEDDLEAFE